MKTLALDWPSTSCPTEAEAMTFGPSVNGKPKWCADDFSDCRVLLPGTFRGPSGTHAPVGPSGQAHGSHLVFYPPCSPEDERPMVESVPRPARKNTNRHFNYAEPGATVTRSARAGRAGCRLAWFVTGGVGVKRRETRCEGRGPASGHKPG